MQWLLDLIETLGVPALLLALLVCWLGRKKGQADVKKTDAETAAALIGIAVGLVEPVSKELTSVRADLEAHKRSDAEGKAARQANSHAHMQWDQTVAEKLRENGIHVEDPPPLYEGGHHD